MSLNDVLSTIDSNLPAATDRLLELLRIPSVSTDPAYAEHCQTAADWLVADLKSIGVEASKRQTPGHPMVVGHAEGAAGKDGPHVLFYGHYDVQPVDPIELWDRDPFDPAVEDTAAGQVIRGRGSSDDKGQLMTFVEACRAWIAVHGALPCNITFFFEGEEESGSPSLIPFMEENAAELTSDIALICDTGLFESKVPAIITMLRGLAGIEVEIEGPSRDLHSGMYGGLVRNPLHVMGGLIAGLHDENGRITLEGFYDDVPELSDDIRAQWQGLGFDHGKFLGDIGLTEQGGEVERTPLEKLWSRPTCEVNGMWGGYTGDGSKTVLPSKANAKITCRLVGQQDPDKVLQSIKDYFEANVPSDYKVSYKGGKGAPAAQMSVAHPAFEQSRKALSDEWPNAAAYVGCGGSIPIAGFFKDILGMDAMLIGFGKDDDQIHSPNEKYDMESFHKGTRSWARILDEISKG
ncbi:dipeptidase [Lentibacter algarum]|uniref:dipeptidase n=1 Tax=Lentibacter algarum TaxID=576131 RepID=UPI001C08728D|nr:dipeptidase [Lentibacter algarum]MBU2982725.1 dipeptidase [Lentibacter algarum]